APTRGHIPFAGFAAGRGSPAHLHGTPDDIYQRVVSPEVPATPLWSPRVAKAGLLGGRMRHLAPTPAPPGFRPSASWPSGRLQPLIAGQIRALRASRGSIRAGMRVRTSPG